MNHIKHIVTPKQSNINRFVSKLFYIIGFNVCSTIDVETGLVLKVEITAGKRFDTILAVQTKRPRFLKRLFSPQF